MESEKENCIRFKCATTKIPLPKEPLPPLPQRLITESHKKECENNALRPPLININHQSVNCQAGPSDRNRKLHDRKRPLKIDTSHVTIRKVNDDLDWDYSVFSDLKDSNRPSTSKDKRKQYESHKESLCASQNKHRPLLTLSRAVTPALISPLPLPNRIKNIKRSLKRPHSKELQGLSPGAKQERNEDKNNKCRLQFNDRLHEILRSPDYWKKTYMKCLERDYIGCVFQHLLSTERKPLDMPKVPNVARTCVINWLLKISFRQGPDSNPAVIQTACWLLDSVLGIAHVELEKLQLIAAACYWIAQKIHGKTLSAGNIAKCANNAFSPKNLIEAESIVLKKLNFPVQPVVAQDFICYFAWWCNEFHPGEIEVAATFLYTSGLMVEKGLCKELPSVLAAASVRDALVLMSMKHLVTRLNKCPVYQAAEKKATNFPNTMLMLRRAVRTISAPQYDYKAPYEHYAVPPKYIAQTVVQAANLLAKTEKIQRPKNQQTS